MYPLKYLTFTDSNTSNTDESTSIFGITEKNKMVILVLALPIVLLGIILVLLVLGYI